MTAKARISSEFWSGAINCAIGLLAFAAIAAGVVWLVWQIAEDDIKREQIVPTDWPEYPFELDRFTANNAAELMHQCAKTNPEPVLEYAVYTDERAVVNCCVFGDHCTIDVPANDLRAIIESGAVQTLNVSRAD